MKNAIVLILLIITIQTVSQSRTVSGFVSDKNSGEKLIGATILETTLKIGTSTNFYGFYSFTTSQKEVEIRFSYVGYKSVIKKFRLDSNIKLNIELEQNNILKEFDVIASENEEIQDDSQMSTVDISMEKVKSLPVLLGEQDLMKTIQLLPGVQSGGEGTSGLYVRGGGPDQNLILLDGVPVYNASHLFGFFSVFNADAINSVQLIKGGFPARYGGRLSSVLDIRMKEGNSKKFQGEGSIGLISSKLSLEGPIAKGKSSFIVSARRTYADIIARPAIRIINQLQFDEKIVAGYYFYDVNAKINHKINKSNTLFLSTYIGNDKFYYNTEWEFGDGRSTFTDITKENIKWGNITGALRCNSIINDKLFSNTTISYSRYKFNVGYYAKYSENNGSDNVLVEYQEDYFSQIQDWTAKIDFDYVPTPNHYIKFGTGYTYHTFKPGVNLYKDLDTSEIFGSSNQYGNEAYIYIEDDIKLGERIKFNVGLHGSSYSINNKNYFSIQPRFSGRYLIEETMSIKASYAKMTQFIHLLTHTSIGLPTDLWVPATDKVAPQYSDQIAIGVAKTVRKQYQVSIEGYYKRMENLIEYKNGATFLGSESDWQEKIEAGKGWSYGGEILVEKKLGKTTGWVGYTLSWTNRQIEELNFGEVFPYRYDRRHDIGVAITHKFDKTKDKKGQEKWIDVGLVFVYGTGNAVTLGLERYKSNKNNNYDSEIVSIGARNNYRMPNYHRLDLGVNVHKKRKRGIQTWSYGLYNAYSRQNPYYLFITTNYQNPNERTLKQLSLFPIMPSVSYNFKF